MKVVILSVGVSPTQKEALHILSKQTGQSVSNLVRQGINQVLGGYGYGQATDKKCSLH